ncbi:C40 family peptidase [Amycolatopsis pigmentata]|uniref:C40 family peptidase n=1 Tax=Amycolatopsis pigmentata TaxID=450801 RepID=A0ABW5FQ10_9PSEU
MGKAAAIGTALVATVILFIAGGAIAVIQALLGSNTNATACTVTGTTASQIGYEPEQLANAATIVAVGKQLGVPEHGWVIAIAAALQESGLRNLDHGDRDSLGLFQQRPSQGWGNPDQIMNPAYAATQFYRHLLAIPGWQNMSVTEAAQAVQHSATPDAYTEHEPVARYLVDLAQTATCINGVSGTGDCTNIQAPNPAALAAINFACGQRGLPYVWGGNGADDGGFDCSGLTKAAYAAAGITLPRTAQMQYDSGARVPDGQPLLPGDLVFYGTPANIHHVGLYIGAGKMIDAPTFGQSVQIEQYQSGEFAGATRPIDLSNRPG